jgi:hypothetical protein
LAVPEASAYMLRLRHFPLCPFSRSIRLALQELDLPH